MPYRLGRYEVLLPLGQRARLGFADELERWLVYRPLDPADEASARRAIGLVHPHIVQVVDVIEDEGEVLDVLEYAPGAMLAELGAISPAVTLRVVKDALLGLDRWHGVLGAHAHLDQKTILVGTDGLARIMRRTPASSGAPRDDVAQLLALVGGEIDPAVRDVCKRAKGTPAEIADALEHAARQTRSMADAAEVSALVGRTVASKLRARRELVAQAARERAERPQSLPDVRTMVGVAAAPATKRPPLPPLPEKPFAKDDGTSELRIAVPTGRIAERASDDILGTATEVPEEEPSVVRPPLAIGDPQAAQKRLALIAGGVGLGLGFILVLVLVTREHAPTEDAKQAMTVASGAVAPSAAAAAEPAPATEAPDVPTLLQVSANAPISTLQIGRRAVESGAPAATMSVELTEEEIGQPLPIVVTSTDGRTATANASPGELEVSVTFGARAKPHPQPAATTKHHWSKHK
jgi:hypothetical protein